MESRLAELFSAIENSLDSKTYSFSDTDYLVKKYLVEYVNDNNALTASARQIESPTEVVETILSNTVSELSAKVGDPEEWYRLATSRVVEFVELAKTNEASEDVFKFASLLPVGHPRADRVTPLTASAHRKALAEWMAADPRLTEESKAAVYSIYSRDEFNNLEIEFENMKLEALVASGDMPKDLLPLVAAFKMSSAARSRMSRLLAKIRRRDREGRFANEFGRLSGIFSDGDGNMFSESGKIVGRSDKPNHYEVQFDGTGKIPAGIYEMDAAKSKNIRGYLPKEAVRDLESKETITPKDAQYAVPLTEFVKTRREVPKGWTKQNLPGGGVKYTTTDGKYSAIARNRSEMKQIMSKLKGYDYIESGNKAGRKVDPDSKGYVVYQEDRVTPNKTDNRFPWINPETGEIVDPPQLYDGSGGRRPNWDGVNLIDENFFPFRGVSNDWSGVSEVTTNARALNDDVDLDQDVNDSAIESVIDDANRAFDKAEQEEEDRFEAGEIDEDELDRRLTEIQTEREMFEDFARGADNDDGDYFRTGTERNIPEIRDAARAVDRVRRGIEREQEEADSLDEVDDDDDVDLDQDAGSSNIDDAISDANRAFDKAEQEEQERFEAGEIDEDELDRRLDEIATEREMFEAFARGEDDDDGDYFRGGTERNIPEIRDAARAVDREKRTAEREQEEAIDAKKA